MSRRSGTVQTEDTTQPAVGPDKDRSRALLKTRRSKW